MKEEVLKKANKTAKQMSLRKRTLLGIGLPAWVLVGFIVAAIMVGVVDEALMEVGLLREGAVSSSVRNATIAALVYLLTLVIIIGVPLKLFRDRTTKENLGLTRLPNWTDILLAPASFVLYTIIAAVLLAVVTGLFPDFDVNQDQDVGFANLSQYYEYVLAFITLVIIAPIAEEVLVRGYLYGKMRAATGLVIAAIVTSLLFSLMHFQWNVALNVLPLGLVMVGLREMTGSIWAGIFLHMLKNGVAYYLLFINPDILNTIG